jgi:HEPN domain-containing protein
MAQLADHQIQYVIWQNRALAFYLAARLDYQNGLYGPAAFSAAQVLELLLKATLIFHDKSFIPEAALHNIPKMLRMVGNKVPNGNRVTVPDFFFHESRYYTATRYPGKHGVGIPKEFLPLLDQTFVELLELVSFQFNSSLVRLLSGGRSRQRTVLMRGNAQRPRLRKFLRRWLDRRRR